MRKDAITNLQIRPESSVDPSTVFGVFKGFLSRAYRICNEGKVDSEVEFLVNIFVEHGYDRSKLEEIAKVFKDKTMTEHQDEILEVQAAHQDGVIEGESLQRDEESLPVVKIPWIPRIGPKLRAAFKKHHVKVVFTAGPNLKDLLCQHKSPLPKNSQPGIYKLECNCSSIYIGETKKKIQTRISQHERDIFHGKWQMSGASEHAKVCKQGFKFEEASTLNVEPFYTQRKIREAVEIRAQRRSRIPVLNRDSGSYLKTTQWDVILARADVNS